VSPSEAALASTPAPTATHYFGLASGGRFAPRLHRSI
jgi:hypothetical protein